MKMWMQFNVMPWTPAPKNWSHPSIIYQLSYFKRLILRHQQAEATYSSISIVHGHSKPRSPTRGRQAILNLNQITAAPIVSRPDPTKQTKTSWWVLSMTAPKRQRTIVEGASILPRWPASRVVLALSACRSDPWRPGPTISAVYFISLTANLSQDGANNEFRGNAMHRPLDNMSPL